MSDRHRQIPSAEVESIAADWLLRREAGLTPPEARELNAWEASDPRHAAALARVGATWSRLDRPRSAGREIELLRALKDRASRRRRRNITAALAVATCCLLGVLTWQGDRLRSPAFTHLVTAPEQRDLPDGSRVDLRAGATIAVDYAGEFRRVTLKGGEAIFHVAEDKTRPFVVTAGDLEVRAVGTAFLVSLENQMVDVVVTHGRIAVAAPTRENVVPRLSPIFLDAGERVLVNEASDVLRAAVTTLTPDELALRLAWSARHVVFSETPLCDAIAIMNRHAAVQLVIMDRDLDRLPVSGRFRVDNTETLVRLLEASSGVRASRVGDTIHLGR